MSQQTDLQALIATWMELARRHETDGAGIPESRGAFHAYLRCANELAALLAAVAPAATPSIEMELREEWWLNHGTNCRPYGDDGEMQCCFLDFKRMPLDELRPRVNEMRLNRLAESYAEYERKKAAAVAEAGADPQKEIQP